MYLLGTDEAGYGPNLGPLVVSTTVWHVPDDLAGQDLYRALKTAVAPGPVEKTDRRCAPIADSKRLYSSGDTWEQLELGLLTAMGACGKASRTWREVWHALSPGELARLDAEHWCSAFDMPTPHAADAARIEKLVARLLKAAEKTGVELRAMASRPVFPNEFNELCDQFDNKSSALSHVTLQLVRDVLEQGNYDGMIVVHCDKHGGRNCYAGLLQHFFPDHFVEVHCEGRAKSVYRFGPPERRIEFRFVAKGDNFLPAALASMACKYLRELAMHAFNGFWQQHVPGLRSTAGYPNDAERFKRDITAAQTRLGICDRVLWRNR
jgi:ribonuclease HII